MAEHLTYPIRSDKLTMTVEVRGWLHSGQSQFQKIDIVDTECFGKMLFLDGHVQLAMLDEAAYHETLVHVSGLNLESVKTALVIGGGDGGILRELLKYESIERIDMAEIDKAVIDACKEHLPELSAGAFDDPRVHLHIGDAVEFVRTTHGGYDLIVLDVTDTYEEEDSALSEKVFSKDFYLSCAKALGDAGYVVAQADNHLFCPYSMRGVLSDLGAVLPASGSFQSVVPSFGGLSGFVWASKGPVPIDIFPSARAARFDLRYLDAATYGFAFRGGLTL